MWDWSSFGDNGLGLTYDDVWPCPGVVAVSRLGRCSDRPRRGKSGRRGVTGAGVVLCAAVEDATSRSELSSFDVLLVSIIKGDGDNWAPPPSERLRVFARPCSGGRT